jgi:hypothetical protein
MYKNPILAPGTPWQSKEGDRTVVILKIETPVPGRGNEGAFPIEDWITYMDSKGNKTKEEMWRFLEKFDLHPA